MMEGESFSPASLKIYARRSPRRRDREVREKVRSYG
jgi:hypothetical protein